MNQVPIAVMAFNRPHYLSQVLDSLLTQHGLGDRPVFLFQDNAVNAYSGVRHAEDADIAASIAVFRERFPRGEVRLAEHNLGVAENFLRAETFVFTELNAEVCYFLEDDMVLSPHYLAMLDEIYGFVAGAERVGYFAAYGKHTMPLEEQRERATAMQRLEHHWAFGLTRKHWLELHRWMEPYYGFVVGRDYHKRPHQEVLRYFRERGFPLTGSAQDGIKKVGTYALGHISINTYACFGKYIGAHGLHLRPKMYEQRGYGTTVLYPEPVALKFPTPEEVEQFHKTELRSRWTRIEREKLAAQDAAKAIAREKKASGGGDAV
jgi:hypothetical protein